MMMGISDDHVDYADATALKLERSRDGVSSLSVPDLRPSEQERDEVQHQGVDGINSQDHHSGSSKALPLNIAEVTESDWSCGFWGRM